MGFGNGPLVQACMKEQGEERRLCDAMKRSARRNERPHTKCGPAAHHGRFLASVPSESKADSRMDRH